MVNMENLNENDSLGGESSTLNGRAQDKRIPIHSRGAATHRHVIVHVAHGVLAANARAGIYASVSHACQRIGTIVVQHALRPAAAVRISEIFRYASANPSVASRIGSARIGDARVRFSRRDNVGCNNNCN